MYKRQESSGVKGKSRGKICTSYSRGQLLRLLATLGIKPTSRIPLVTQDAMIEIISEIITMKELNTIPPKELKIIYQWIQDHKESSQLCSILRKHFEDNDMILVI